MSQSSATDQIPDDWVSMSNIWSPEKMAKLLGNNEIVPYVLRGHWETKGEKRRFVNAIMDGDPNKIQAATKDLQHPGETISGVLTIQGGMLVFIPDNRVPAPPKISKIVRRSECTTAFTEASPSPTAPEVAPENSAPLKVGAVKTKSGGLLSRLGFGKKNI